MNRRMEYTMAILAALMSGFTGTSGAVSVPPWSESFETNPANSLISSFPDWYGSDAAVIVQTDVVWTAGGLGTNAVVVPPGKIASNRVASASSTNVWFDFYVTNSGAMAAGVVGADAMDTNLTVELYVETNGYPVVLDPVTTNWMVCSNDYWGTMTTHFNTNAWMRFTVCANYSNKTAAVFLDGHLLKQQVRFINTNKTHSGRFEMDSGSSLTSYFDQVSALYAPTNMTLDLDHDGMADADEIQIHGATTVRYRPVITVTQPAHGAITPPGSFDILPGSTTNFTLLADPAYGVAQVLTNGQAVTGFAGQNTRNVAYTWTSVIPDGLSDGTFSAVITYTGLRYVPQDYATLQDALAAALAGDTVIANSGSLSSAMIIGNGLTLVATNTTLSGGLTVNAGTTGTLASCTGLVVGNTTVNGLLVVSNGSMNVGTLTLGAGATVRVVNATAFVVNGVTMTGTFTLDASWTQALVPQTPPFADDFERYPAGQMLSGAGLYGWSTPVDDGVMVQSGVVTQGDQAVLMPAGSVLSNSLAPAASSNVWVEWYYRESGRIDESTAVLTGSDTNLTVMLFINTNGYVTVYNPETGSGAFSVLSNDVWDCPVTPLSTSDWPRITVNMNYVTHRAAVLLNGRLLAQQLRFINTNKVNCARIEWDAGSAGATYLDALNVQTNGASVVSSDVGNGTPVAMVIDLYGYVMIAHGSIFTVR